MEINTFLYLSSQFQSASKWAWFIFILSAAQWLIKNSKAFLIAIHILL